MQNTIALEMKLQAALGASLLMTGGAVSEIEVLWTRALPLAESLGDIDHQLRALLGLWLLSDREAHSLARQFFGVASALGDRLFGEFMIAVSSHWSGDLNTARYHLERIIDHDVGDDRGRLIIRFQGDQRLLSRAFFARTLWLQGLDDLCSK